jgi:hypothetical protein
MQVAETGVHWLFAEQAPPSEEKQTPSRQEESGTEQSLLSSQVPPGLAFVLQTSLMQVSPETAQSVLSLQLPPLGERQMLLTHEEPGTTQSAAASLESQGSPASEKNEHLERIHDSVAVFLHWLFASHLPPVAGRALHVPPMQTSRRHWESEEQAWAFTSSDVKKMKTIARLIKLTVGKTPDALSRFVLAFIVLLLLLVVVVSFFVLFVLLALLLCSFAFAFEFLVFGGLLARGCGNRGKSPRNNAVAAVRLKGLCRR